MEEVKYSSSSTYQTYSQKVLHYIYYCSVPNLPIPKNYQNEYITQFIFSVTAALRSACVLSEKQSKFQCKDRCTPLTFLYLSYRYVIWFPHLFTLCLWTRKFQFFMDNCLLNQKLPPGRINLPKSLKLRCSNSCTNWASRSSSFITSKIIIKCVKPECFWYEHPLTLYKNRKIMTIYWKVVKRPSRYKSIYE